jgi:hypothetical protein
MLARRGGVESGELGTGVGIALRPTAASGCSHMISGHHTLPVWLDTPNSGVRGPLTIALIGLAACRLARVRCGAWPLQLQ